MSFTPGSLFGQFKSATGTLAGAFSPTVGPLFSIVSPGGKSLLSVSTAGVVSVPGIASSIAPLLAAIPLTISQYNSLPANPSASQICLALNNPTQSDLLQCQATNGAVIFRLSYLGVALTS
jgi:hypothetical protein